MSRLLLRGIGARVVIACLLVASLALAIVGAGVLEVARVQFERLMMKHGASAGEAHTMFQQTVGDVFAAAAAVAFLVSVLLAVLLSRYISRPLAAIGAGARRLTRGDYGTRVQARGPAEIRVLAAAFNSMAESLDRQEQVRRDFIAGAAHELLTPLTNLQGYLEGLRDGVIAPSAGLFGSLHEESERLVRLSRTLLDLADGSSGNHKTEQVDLSKAIISTLQLAGPPLERRRITVLIDLADRLLVRANPDHVTQVLFNLLQNADRYTEDGGRVTVSAAAENDAVRVIVSNTGAPIPTHEVGRLFERFYRADPSRDRVSGGHGLGLALVKQLVEGAGGHVGVDSGAGTTRFWFTVPASSGTPSGASTE